jgi:hypothetical protein
MLNLNSGMLILLPMAFPAKYRLTIDSITITNGGGIVTIIGSEGSSGPLRNPHNAKTVVANHIHGCNVFVPARGLPLRMNVHRDRDAEHRQTAGCGNRVNTRQGGHPLANPRINNRAGGAAAMR